MADTGFKYPSTNPTSTGWYNPTYDYSDDDSRAMVKDLSARYPSDYGGFSFGIPEGATINGIEAVIAISHSAQDSFGSSPLTGGLQEVPNNLVR